MFVRFLNIQYSVGTRGLAECHKHTREVRRCLDMDQHIVGFSIMVFVANK